MVTTGADDSNGDKRQGVTAMAVAAAVAGTSGGGCEGTTTTATDSTL